MKGYLFVVSFFVMFMSSTVIVGAQTYAPLPDEYESLGGHILGLGNAGSAAVVGQSSIRANPAMLSFERKYQLSAGYHWPAEGLDFYQLGIVDSQTSNVAAGVVYTHISKKMKFADYIKLPAKERTPVTSRLAVALSAPIEKLSLGVTGVRVEGVSLTSKRLSGYTLALGAAALIVPALRVAASVENLGNRDVVDLAPRTYRLGGAYIVADGIVTVHLDYTDRQRVYSELLVDPTSKNNEEILSPAKSMPNERMLTLSGSVRFYNLLRLLGAYGYAFDNSKRRMGAIGVALVNQNYSVSFLLSRPYWHKTSLHQAVNLDINLLL